MTPAERKGCWMHHPHPVCCQLPTSQLWRHTQATPCWPPLPSATQVSSMPVSRSKMVGACFFSLLLLPVLLLSFLFDCCHDVSGMRVSLCLWSLISVMSCPGAMTSRSSSHGGNHLCCLLFVFSSLFILKSDHCWGTWFIVEWPYCEYGNNAST